MPIRRCSGSTHVPLPATPRPLTAIRPASGVSNPAITRSSVVFPEPLGPSSATSSPCSTRERRAVDGAGAAEALVDAAGIDRRFRQPHE